MSEVIKIGYRGFGGLIVFSLILAFAVTSLAFFVTGALMIAFSIYVFINPSILNDLSVNLIETRVNDPIMAIFLLFVIGFIIILFGGGFMALTSYLAKGMFAIDRELSFYVDKKVPKTGEVVNRLKGSKDDKISKLERLGVLRDKGILTEQEFEQEKQLILKENS